jgi:hypothetical protein
VWREFVQANKEAMSKASQDGLLNHQLLAEEGGLGVVHPEDTARRKRGLPARVRTTVTQKKIANALYEGSRDG